MEHVIVLFRVKTISGIFTIGNMQKIGKNDLDWYVKLILNVLYFKSDEYKQEIIEDFIFSFGVRQGEIRAEDRVDYIKQYNQPNYQSYKNYKIPATFEPKGYGSFRYQ